MHPVCPTEMYNEIMSLNKTLGVRMDKVFIVMLESIGETINSFEFYM